MRPQSDCSGCANQSQATSGPSEWMTVAEMQEYMHAGRTKAYELIKAGEVRSYRLGRRILVNRLSLDRYIKANGALGDQPNK